MKKRGGKGKQIEEEETTKKKERQNEETIKRDKEASKARGMQEVGEKKIERTKSK